MSPSCLLPQQVIPHELYQPREVYYDIALLLLDRSVKFYSHIWPACLHSPSIIMKGDETLSLSGWTRNAKRSNMLVKTKLSVVADLECQKFYDDTKYEISLPNGVVGDDLMCARNSNCESEKFLKLKKIFDNFLAVLVIENVLNFRFIFNLVLSCLSAEADSDGPVYFYFNNTFFIFAIATNIETNCDSSRLGIFIKVSSVLEWIEGIVL